MKHKVRDPVDRFISRFNFNRSEKRINAKLLSDTRIHDIIPETWWTRTSGCRERNFMWISKRRGEDPIWPSASLASSLSVFIRSAVAIFSSHVCCQHCITAKVLTMWFQGTVPQYQRLYRADSQVRSITFSFASLAFSRSLGFVEPQSLAERWATLILCHLRSLILKEIFWLLESWRRWKPQNCLHHHPHLDRHRWRRR